MAQKQLDIYIGNDRLDLFEDESIVITRRVQDVRDISKVYTDYSQSFNVPASPNNNRIFRHWYNADIDDGFNYDAKIKQPGRVEINTIPFLPVRVRLEKAVTKRGRPTQYNITLFGQLTALSDVFKEDTLKALNFDAYNHGFNIANLGLGFRFDDASGLFNGDIVYTAINPQRRFSYSFNEADNTNTSKRLNIAKQPIDLRDITVAIRMYSIFDRIMQKYGVTFTDQIITGDNITNPWFRKLYMTLGNDEEGLQFDSSDTQIALESGPASFDQTIWNDPCETSNGPSDGPVQVKHALTINPNPGFENVPYTLVLYDFTNSVFIEEEITGPVENWGQWYTKEVNDPGPNTSDNVTRQILYYIRPSKYFQFTGNMTLIENIKDPFCDTQTTETDLGPLSAGSSVPDIFLRISRSMPDLTVKEFVTGVMKAFNLVVVPQSETDFYVNTLDAWYAEGTVYENFERYISSSGHELTNPTRLGEISFKYQDAQTLLANEFFNQNARYYGNLEYIVQDQSGEPVGGNSLDIELPFEQMVYERVPNDSGGNTQMLYGLKTNEQQEPTGIEPHIFFNINRQMNFFPVRLDNGTSDPDTIFACNQPSHIDDEAILDANVGLTFGEEIEEFYQLPIPHTLFNGFYQDYVTDIFSPKRRIYNFKGRVPTHILAVLKLNDKLIIDGRRYLINKMEINLTTNEVGFELLNDIY